MGNPRGFLDVKRQDPGYRPVEERIQDYKEVEKDLNDEEIKQQASRCMDCGIPFCHGSGCPLTNQIPEWNDLVYRGYWKEALAALRYTNNFPEFTGRICPAPCETACTVGIDGDDPVAIRQIEKNLSEKGYTEGITIPNPPAVRTGKNIAVIGSGPAGLAAADQLNQMGHTVTIFERAQYPGGYLRYGIPDFKLDKKVVERRLKVMEDEGVKFECGVAVGEDITGSYLKKNFDAICMTVGARQARDLPVPGRELPGVHFAMEFLGQSNQRVSGEKFSEDELWVEGKKVLVIGGGDTGSDCVGTSNRQKAAEITQIEIMPKPPQDRDESTPWPQWPYQLRTSSSHKEGCERMWNIMTKSFEAGPDGRVQKVHAVEVRWVPAEDGNRPTIEEIPGSEFVIEADYVFLAMGFTGVEKAGLVEQLDLGIDGRGNIAVDENWMTTNDGVFASGDASAGASLVVRAIAAGRKMADKVNAFLK